LNLHENNHHNRHISLIYFRQQATTNWVQQLSLQNMLKYIPRKLQKLRPHKRPWRK